MRDNEKGNGPAGGNGEAIEGTGMRLGQDDLATHRAELEPLFSAGLQFIPLNAPKALDRRGRPIGKAPARKNWRTDPPLTLDEAAERLASGRNVGVRLRETDLVVDVDPRNFAEGDDPVKRLERGLGIKLDDFPTVLTGSGGTHHYLRKPADLAVRDSLTDYQGIEFKTFGRQVVAPGSIHPETGKAYLTDPLSTFGMTPEAPERLLGAVRRADSYRDDAEAGTVEPERLTELLDALDPADFADQARWLELMMACHHATAGHGRDEFVAWSIGDPAYADHEAIIGRRWDSLDSRKAGRKVTVGTLYKALKDAGRGDLVPPPPRASAQEDFAGEDADVGDLPVLASPPPAPSGRGKAKLSDEELVAAQAGCQLRGITPVSLAKVFVRWWEPVVNVQEDWLRYNAESNVYEPVPDREFSKPIWMRLNGMTYWDEAKQRIAHLAVTKTVVANVLDAAVALRLGPRELPAWLDGAGEGVPPASDLIVVRNGLLDWRNRALLPATADFVSRNGTPVPYDPSAAPPTEWLRFLADVFPDEECIAAFQEMVGYLLTQDNAYQKMFFLYGQKRSGKGTVVRIIQALVGKGNYTVNRHGIGTPDRLPIRTPRMARSGTRPGGAVRVAETGRVPLR